MKSIENPLQIIIAKYGRTERRIVGRSVKGLKAIGSNLGPVL
jgi:hypothetical protein